MQKHLLSASVVITLIGSAELAALDIPISRTYGGASACSLYTAGGGNAVFSAGASIGRKVPKDVDEPDYLIVSPSEIVGFEWACEPKSVDGEAVTLQCPGSQVSADFGEQELVTAIVRENMADATLSFTDEIGTVVLPSCNP